MMVIGVDTHKSSHAMAAVIADTGLLASEREPGKSDQIDARAVARAVLKEGVERFPTAFLDEQALEIRLLADHRADLVAERTRQINGRTGPWRPHRGDADRSHRRR